VGRKATAAFLEPLNHGEKGSTVCTVVVKKGECIMIPGVGGDIDGAIQ
jgi:hypothetical protein